MSTQKQKNIRELEDGTIEIIKCEEQKKKTIEKQTEPKGPMGYHQTNALCDYQKDMGKRSREFI